MKRVLKRLGVIFVSIIIITPIVSGLVGGLIGYYLASHRNISQNEHILNFYESEMAATISPATLKKWVDEKDQNYVLVDLRSEAEYNTEHFISSINIPAVSMSTEQLISSFKALDKSKTIIVHCYSTYCTLGSQVGLELARNGIYVKELNIGWSELRYHWDLWNPGAKVTDGEKYIIKGDNTLPKPSNLNITPCVQGQYGC